MANRLRELRQLGVLVKRDNVYAIRPGINSLDETITYIRGKLEAHVVAMDLRAARSAPITHSAMVDTLKHRYAAYNFSDKTWDIYASYLAGWMRYAKVDIASRIVLERSGTSGESYTPQLSPEEVLAGFQELAFPQGIAQRPVGKDKLLYDLKNLGLITYSGQLVSLTKTGKSCKDLHLTRLKPRLAELACNAMKILYSARIIKRDESVAVIGPTRRIRRRKEDGFVIGIKTILTDIKSNVYLNKTINLLRAWGIFVVTHSPESISDQ